MQQRRVAIVVLNWNGQQLLEEFLPSVVRFSDLPGCRVYLADNASADGSVAWVHDTFGDRVSIISNPGNFGFARGYNTALRGLKEEYFVLLNSDVEVTENWLAPVIGLLDASPEVAACQPKVLDYRRRDRFEYAGAAGGHMDWLGYPFCRGRIFRDLEPDQGQYNGNETIFWASGAAFFVRARAFREAGGFDEELFAHMEEIDLCWRLQRMGYTIMACPESTVYHLGGGTLHEGNPRKTYLNFRNNRLILTRNLPAGAMLSNWFLRNLLDAAAAAQAFASGRFREGLAVLRALAAFHLLLPRWLGKRRRTATLIRQACGRRPAQAHRYGRSIAYLYYVKGIKKYSDLP